MNFSVFRAMLLKGLSKPSDSLLTCKTTNPKWLAVNTAVHRYKPQGPRGQQTGKDIHVCWLGFPVALGTAEFVGVSVLQEKQLPEWSYGSKHFLEV